MFPEEQILYLSPHSNHILHKWNHDDVIVLGGIVDRSKNLPLSLGKAKKLNFRHAKLPLGYYIDGYRLQTNQAFAIHVIFNILSAMKITNDWNEAFRKIPHRYINNLKKGINSGETSF